MSDKEPQQQQPAELETAEKVEAPNGPSEAELTQEYTIAQFDSDINSVSANGQRYCQKSLASLAAREKVGQNVN